MRRVGRGSIGRFAAMVAIGAGAVVAPLAGVAAAGEAGGSGDTKPGEVLATLRIDAPNVEVQKVGADEFKAAEDGQKLREGDTVRTDATGRAEVDYSDTAYTRLDVNTTFTITKLTEEQGERQVEGSLESGRTWNRTEALTESKFEQSGGGATAAVAGTAFMAECTSLEHCEYTAVVHDVILFGDGEEQLLTPRDQCDSTGGDLCDEPRTLTEDEMAAITWIQENLLRDLLERGYGPGPFVVSGVLIVEDGVVVDFIETTPPSTEPSGPTGGGGGGPQTFVVDPDKPVLVADQASEQVFFAEVTCPPRIPQDCVAADHIEVTQGEAVVFTANIAPGTDTTGYRIRFLEIQDDEGVFMLCADPEQSCSNVQNGQDFSITHVFSLAAQPNSTGSGFFTFEVLQDGLPTGQVVEVPVTVVESGFESFAASTAVEPGPEPEVPNSSSVEDPPLTEEPAPSEEPAPVG